MLFPVKLSQGIFIYRPWPSISQLINSQPPRIKLSHPPGCTFTASLKQRLKVKMSRPLPHGDLCWARRRGESTFIPLETKEQSGNNKRVKAAKTLPPRRFAGRWSLRGGLRVSPGLTGLQEGGCRSRISMLEEVNLHLKPVKDWKEFKDIHNLCFRSVPVAPFREEFYFSTQDEMRDDERVRNQIIKAL